MKFEQVVLFQLSCLQACFQGFKTFTSVAVKWPLTSTNYNRVLLLTKVNLHAKYEVWPSCTFGSYSVYKVFGLWPLLLVKWPLTCTNFNRVLVLTKVDLHTKYEVWPSCTFAVIVFNHDRIDYFCLRQGIRNYLSNRQQCSDINKSDPLLIMTGVPQGSILGPLLLIIYVNDLPSCFESSNVNICWWYHFLF